MHYTVQCTLKTKKCVPDLPLSFCAVSSEKKTYCAIRDIGTSLCIHVAVRIDQTHPKQGLIEHADELLRCNQCILNIQDIILYHPLQIRLHRENNRLFSVFIKTSRQLGKPLAFHDCKT